MAIQTVQLQFVGQSWSGSVAIDDALAAGENLLLTRFGTTSGDSPLAILGTSNNEDFSDELEQYEFAFTFTFDNNSYTISGPNFVGNSRRDEGSLYLWTPVGDWDAFIDAIDGQLVTLTLDDGAATQDGPWSDLLGLLTADGPWSAILDELGTTNGPWSNLVSQATTHGQWSAPLGLLTQHGPWSGFVSSATSDGPWSQPLSTTIDGPWSEPLAVNETLDGSWSDIVGGLDTLDGPWSLPIYVTIQTGVLVLDTPDLPLNLTEDTPGNYSVDISWTGLPEHTALHQVRARWISRSNGRSTPAPDHAEAGDWDEVTAIVVEGDFEYLDTIIANPDMSLMGEVALDNQMLMMPDWAGRAVWMFARLEVEDGSKLNRPAPGTNP